MKHVRSLSVFKLPSVHQTNHYNFGSKLRLRQDWEIERIRPEFPSRTSPLWKFQLFREILLPLALNNWIFWYLHFFQANVTNLSRSSQKERVHVWSRLIPLDPSRYKSKTLQGKWHLACEICLRSQINHSCATSFTLAKLLEACRPCCLDLQP